MLRVDNWDFASVSAWLRKIGLEKYIDLFYRHEIDGEILLTMTEKDLYSPILKIPIFADIRKFGVAVEKLKAENKTVIVQASVDTTPHFTTPVYSSNLENKFNMEKKIVRASTDAPPLSASNSLPIDEITEYQLQARVAQDLRPNWSVEKRNMEKKNVQASVDTPTLSASNSSPIDEIPTEYKLQVIVAKDFTDVASSEKEYDNDIEAALNGAAYVGVYEEEFDDLYFDYDYDYYADDSILIDPVIQGERIRNLPTLNVDIETKVKEWLDTVQVL